MLGCCPKHCAISTPPLKNVSCRSWSKNGECNLDCMETFEDWWNIAFIKDLINLYFWRVGIISLEHFTSALFSPEGLSRNTFEDCIRVMITALKTFAGDWIHERKNQFETVSSNESDQNYPIKNNTTGSSWIPLCFCFIKLNLRCCHAPQHNEQVFYHKLREDQDHTDCWA